MQIVLESMSSAEDAMEQDLVMRSLQRLGFLQSRQCLADGAWLIDVDADLMADLAQTAALFPNIRLSTVQ
ncbi:hypothetical protein [Cupriavidus sp. H18C2]|uniref:hypothetical protein n=1 Tax=Cupriavidus sp. H18C2 TaxID=3241602 RepID=UPI003BF889EF